MAESKYSVILMRDDHTVRHYNFRSLWIRVFLCSILFLLFASVLFGYATCKLWLKTNHLKKINHSKDVLLQQKNVRLDRLENIEKVIAFRDPEQLEKLLTGQITDPYLDDSSPRVDLQHFYHSVHSERFSISNLKIDAARKHALHLRFDLKNLQENEALRGKADVVLLTNKARSIQHSLSENNQLFQIRHYKTFNASIPLPDGVFSNDIFALRITISGPRGKILFGKAVRLDEAGS